MNQGSSLSGSENQSIESKSPRELVFRYSYFLPLFLLILAVSIVITYLYLRYTTPIYESRIEILIKDDSRKSGTDLSNQILSQLVSSGKTNIANEIEIIRSPVIMKRVVENLGLNVGYYSKGRIRQLELYDTSRNRFIIFGAVSDSVNSHEVDIQVNGNKAYYIKGKSKTEIQNNTVITDKGFDFALHIDNFKNFRPGYTYKAVWSPPYKIAQAYSSQLRVDALNKEASILLISYLSSIPQKGVDILNGLSDAYSDANIDDKNKTMDNTIDFVNQRLLLISGELGGVEDQLKNFRQQNNVINVDAQENAQLQRTSGISEKMDEAQIRLKVTDMISDYVNDPSRKFNLVPSSLGIEDPTLLELVKSYNEGVLQRDELLKTLPPGNIEVTTLEDQLVQLQGKIVENVANIKKSLTSMYDQAKAEYDQILAGINTIPEKQKELLEIERQQGIKEKLYLYLLEKREESAITRASAVANSIPIEPATCSGAPVEPNPTNLYLISLLISIFVPVGFVFLRDLLNDKIITRADIVKYTDIPTIGEINHTNISDRKIVVGKSRGMISEQFRIIRTNLQYFHDPENKISTTMLITSTIVGEGKTFVSMNLAAVLALAGKKVALVEFDLRKPKITKALNLENSETGITTYLLGKSTIEEIGKPISGYENLILFSTGLVPPNPSELLLNPRMNNLFKELKASFDYIIIDCPPIGIVSDAKVLARYSDINIYLVRQRFTFKKQLEFVNDLYKQQTLKNMALIVNDVVGTGVDSYYGYSGYYGNGSGYNYNYDYNFGYEDSGKNIFVKWLKGFRKQAED